MILERQIDHLRINRLLDELKWESIILFTLLVHDAILAWTPAHLWNIEMSSLDESRDIVFGFLDTEPIMDIGSVMGKKVNSMAQVVGYVVLIIEL